MRKTTFEHYRSKVGAIMKTTLVPCLLVMFIVGTFHPAEAQTLPTDPIQTTCIVPSAPGAGHPMTPPEGFTSLCQPPDSIWDISHNDVPASPPTDPMGNGDAPAPPPSDTTGPPHWLGVQTPANVRGILGTFQVRDTPVQHIPPTDDFVNQHLLVKSCDGSRWLEVGWTEVGWHESLPDQYLHIRTPEGWGFFTGMPIFDLQAVKVALMPTTGNYWGAFVYWGTSGWVLLSEYDLGASVSCGAEMYAEINMRSGYDWFPPLTFGTSLPSDTQVADELGNWKPWDTSLPTTTRDSANQGRYHRSTYIEYYHFFVYSGPSFVLNVPTKGSLLNTFSARTYHSADISGPFHYYFDWGDGSTNSQGWGNAEHQYSEPGTYTVRAELRDGNGELYFDQRQVTVCVQSEAEPCTSSNPTDDPCYETKPTVCEGDYPPPLPEEVSDSLDEVQDETGSVTADVESIPRAALSPNNRVLVVSANLEQVYAGPKRCKDFNPEIHDIKDWKACDKEARQARFADRLGQLSLKALGRQDGMGYIPDVLLLQEVDKATIDSLIAKIRTYTGFEFDRAAGYNRQGHIIEDGPAGINDYCDKTESPGACAKRTSLHTSNYVLYNTQTMSKLRSTYLDLKYPINEGRDCPGADPMVVPAKPVVDEDGDGEDDCVIKWTRQYSALLFKMPQEHEGSPALDQGVTVAVTSTHLLPPSYFDNDSTVENRKEVWTSKLANHLRRTYPGADTYTIGGDLNIHRCYNKSGAEAGDWSPDPPLCLERSWWHNLTTSPTQQNPEYKGFEDPIYELYRESPNDRLLPQYRDGCAVALNAQGGCDLDNERRRRIDYVFSFGMSVLAASHDLTCGESPQSGDIPPNCDALMNKSRYSDHRLVWSLIGTEG